MKAQYQLTENILFSDGTYAVSKRYAHIVWYGNIGPNIISL